MAKNLKSIFGENHLLDERSVTFLTKALEKNNLPGFDYLEYKQSLAALANMNMDEETAFKSAYATASTMGLTKEKLLQTAAHYQKVINNEKEEFGKAMANQMNQKVAGKQQEVEKLKVQIEKHKAHIRQLEEQVAKFQKTIDSADEEVNSAREKIESASEKFEFAHQSVMNQIEKDVENINKYL